MALALHNFRRRKRATVAPEHIPAIIVSRDHAAACNAPVLGLDLVQAALLAAGLAATLRYQWAGDSCHAAAIGSGHSDEELHTAIICNTYPEVLWTHTSLIMNSTGGLEIRSTTTHVRIKVRRSP